MEYTIEDCLEMLVGFKADLGVFKVDPKDATVFNSISKQITKNIALTDKQYELIRTKLSADKYAVQFENKGMAITYYYKCLENTRMPLRDIDRSKYVTLVDTVDAKTQNNVYWKSKLSAYLKEESSQQCWIKIGFPFNKKLVALVDKLGTDYPYYLHEHGTRDHYFKFDENIAYEILSEFKNKEFEIDQELLDFYEKLEYIKQHESEFLPRVANGALENFHSTTEEYLVEQFGPPSEENIVQYKDVSLLYDIRHFDDSLLESAKRNLSPLSDCLINRNSTQVLIRPKEWKLDEVVKSVYEIKRLPLLVIVGTDTALADLKASYKLLGEHVSAEEVSVLFRLDNDTNADFNEYVKKEGLNSPVTEDTKVVYICKDKLPKPLLKAGWTPRCVIRLGSTRVQTKIDQWTYECDMVIHYDEVATQWAPTYASTLDIGSKKRKIEKI